MTSQKNKKTPVSGNTEASICAISTLTQEHDNTIPCPIQAEKELTKVTNNSVKMICMEDIQSQEVDWLWYPYIPYGKLTIVQGDPGEGKTTFVLQLAAALSKGFSLGETDKIIEPIKIIYQTAEDGLADTVKPRLEAAKADCRKILVIDDSDFPLDMIDERLEKAVIQTGAKLLVLDPLQAYLGDKVDMNRANETREVTKRLSALAERTGCAIVLVGHMNKGSGAKAAYRGMGSIDFFAVARSVLLVARVPDKPNIRAIAQIKNNLAPEGDTVAFILDDGFTWLGSYDISVDELLGGFPTTSKKGAAKEFIKKLFEEKDSYPSNEIFAKGKELGISKRTLETAKNELGIGHSKVKTVWHWKKSHSEFKTATPQGV